MVRRRGRRRYCGFAPRHGIRLRCGKSHLGPTGVRPLPFAHHFELEKIGNLTQMRLRCGRNQKMAGRGGEKPVLDRGGLRAAAHHAAQARRGDKPRPDWRSRSDASGSRQARQGANMDRTRGGVASEIENARLASTGTAVLSRVDGLLAVSRPELHEVGRDVALLVEYLLEG